MHSSLFPAAQRFLTARAVAVLAVPALSTTLLAGTASAVDAPTFFVGQNTSAGATVTTGDGGSHRLASHLRAVAGDGTVHVLSADVTPTRTAAVLVDGETGVGRIVRLDPEDASLDLFGGRGSVVVREGAEFSLLDVATGASTALAGLPPADEGTRQVTATAATGGGALVATADVSSAGTSGQVHGASVWRLTPQGAELLHSVSGRYIPAVAAGPSGVDVVLASVADDSLTHLRIGDGVPVETPMHRSLTPDLFLAELGYAHAAAGLVPVLTLTGSEGAAVYDMDGEVLRSYDAGARVFVSAGDLTDPSSVSNRLSKGVTLSGVRDGQVLAYGTRVAPTVSASAWGVLPRSAAPAALTVRTGGRATPGVSGRRIPLTTNTCFTGSSPGTLFASAARPVTRCVDVAHRLVLASFGRHGRVAVVETSASQLRVQVLRKRTTWVTVRQVTVHRGVATFTAPRGRVRVVAPASASNGAATLLVAPR